MGLFGQARDLYRLQKQAKKVKEELKNLHIEAELRGIAVVVSAEMEVISVTVAPEYFTPEKKDDLQKTLAEALNKAMKKAQEVAAEKMRDVMGDLGMNLPGMTDGPQQ